QRASDSATTVRLLDIHVQDHRSPRLSLGQNARPRTDHNPTAPHDLAFIVHGQEAAIRSVRHCSRKVLARRFFHHLERALVPAPHVPPHHAPMPEERGNVIHRRGANRDTLNHLSFDYQHNQTNRQIYKLPITIYQFLHGFTVTITTPCDATVAVNFPVNRPRSLCCHKSRTAAEKCSGYSKSAQFTVIGASAVPRFSSTTARLPSFSGRAHTSTSPCFATRVPSRPSGS